MSAIIVSDLHIGSKYCLHQVFERFLDNIPEDYELILNGDIVDDPSAKLEHRDQDTALPCYPEKGSIREAVLV